MTAYRFVAPLGVECESGVKDGKGTGAAVSPSMGVSRVGNGEPMNRVGVSVADGGCGVSSANDWVQAPSARMSSRDMGILLFMLFPFIATILAFFERDCKRIRDSYFRDYGVKIQIRSDENVDDLGK